MTFRNWHGWSHASLFFGHIPAFVHCLHIVFWVRCPHFCHLHSTCSAQSPSSHLRKNSQHVLARSVGKRSRNVKIRHPKWQKKQTILMGSHSWSSLKMPRIFTQLNKNLTKAQEFPEPLEQWNYNYWLLKIPTIDHTILNISPKLIISQSAFLSKETRSTNPC